MFASVKSPTGDTDRAIETQSPAGGRAVTTLFDFPGTFDSAPAWSPDGTKIAFESNVNVLDTNPGNDMEIWVMNADGSHPVKLTDNTAHDEGPGVVARRHDARLLERADQPHGRHQRHDRGGRAPAHAHRLHGP